jgi:hypothetical protein
VVPVSHHGRIRRSFKQINTITLPDRIIVGKIFHGISGGFEMARSISDPPEQEEQQEQPDKVDMEKLADMLYSVFLAVQDLNDKVYESNETIKELKRLNGL